MLSVKSKVWFRMSSRQSIYLDTQTNYAGSSDIFSKNIQDEVTTYNHYGGILEKIGGSTTFPDVVEAAKGIVKDERKIIVTKSKILLTLKQIF